MLRAMLPADAGLAKPCPTRSGQHVDPVKGISPLKPLLPFVALLFLVPGHAEPPGADDPRLPRDGTSPAWLTAVGQLHVPGHRRRDGEEEHHVERCSATLVSQPGATRSEYIVTAWHCLEWYDDLSQTILFTLHPDPGMPLQRSARPLASGGAMAEDWAVLKLQRPVPAGRVRGLPLDLESAATRSPLWMAGYSRDVGTGADGKVLSYHPNCHVTGTQGLLMDTNCRAYKGASGGAVIRLDESGTPRLNGVISAGNGADISRFVPVTSFARALPATLRRP